MDDKSMWMYMYVQKTTEASRGCAVLGQSNNLLPSRYSFPPLYHRLPSVVFRRWGKRQRKKKENPNASPIPHPHSTKQGRQNKNKKEDGDQWTQ